MSYKHNIRTDELKNPDKPTKLQGDDYFRILIKYITSKAIFPYTLFLRYLYLFSIVVLKSLLF
jgi:hypothetical protein